MNGRRLAAADNNNGRIYTSPDYGVTWTAHASGSIWCCDGSGPQLVLIVFTDIDGLYN